MDQTEFIDLCILCGCDYTHTIGGMGPKTAYTMLKEHETIEGVLKEVESRHEDPAKKKKFMVPEKFLYEESRELFRNPDVIRDKEVLQSLIKFDKPDEAMMKEWLVNSKGFTEVKVANGLERLKKCQGKKNQGRLDCFFKVSSVLSSTKKVEAPGKGKKTGKPSMVGAKKGLGKKSI